MEKWSQQWKVLVIVPIYRVWQILDIIKKYML